MVFESSQYDKSRVNNTHMEDLKKTPNIWIYIEECFSQKNDLNIEKIKVKFPQIFLALISTLKEENEIVLTKMAPG